MSSGDLVILFVEGLEREIGSTSSSTVSMVSPCREMVIGVDSESVVPTPSTDPLPATDESTTSGSVDF